MDFHCGQNYMDGRNMLKQMSTQVEVFKYESTTKKARDSITLLRNNENRFK